LHRATDVAGGFQAWRATGLPVIHPTTPTPPRLAPAANRCPCRSAVMGGRRTTCRRCSGS
jgi:hypothetical protein